MGDPKIEHDGTSLKVVSGVDSDSLGERSKRVVRLEQAALHVQHLAEASGYTPPRSRCGSPPPSKAGPSRSI